MADPRSTRFGARKRWLMFAACAGILGGATPSVAQSPVVDAAKRADWSTLRSLLADGEDVNGTSGDGATALHWASYWDDLATAELLVGLGAKVNVANDLGATPLWSAALNGSPEMARRLLNAGADPNAALLLGETVLMTASRSGNAEVVRQLLERGADPNLAAARGQTALMWAAAQRHPEVVRLLLRHEADVHARSEVWHDVMAVPPHSDRENQAVIPHGGNTALLFAARVGDLESTRALVDAGADINDADAWGVSATVLAAHSGYVVLLEYLLDQGANANASDGGFSALHVAIMRRDARMTSALLAHGADPNAPVESWTPTRRLSQDWNFHQALVGASPLWLAARFNEPSVVRLLLEHGADIHFVHHADYVGGVGAFGSGRITETTPVLLAALGVGTAGRPFNPASPSERRTLVPEVVRTLVEFGADVNSVDGTGHSPLDAAQVLGDEELVLFLREHGATESEASRPSPSRTG